MLQYDNWNSQNRGLQHYWLSIRRSACGRLVELLRKHRIRTTTDSSAQNWGITFKFKVSLRLDWFLAIMVEDGCVRVFGAIDLCGIFASWYYYTKSFNILFKTRDYVINFEFERHPKLKISGKLGWVCKFI